jgi:shikimate dehydrogenase
MPAPERYAVIGHPVAHSRSPRIHSLFALQTHQNLIYSALDTPPSLLAQRVQDFFGGGGRGLSVTVPHKQTVIALTDTLTERARAAAAVNTLARDPGGALLGDNTDGVGLVRDLTLNLQITLTSRRVLLLGAGGAARGVLGPLLQLEPQQVVIANRSAERAVELAEAFATLGNVRGGGFAELDGSAFDLILNATAASLQGEIPPLPASVLAAGTICYDFAYARVDTPFTRWARAGGAAGAHMGLGMLVEQAAEAFHLWRGVRPLTAPVLTALASSYQE